MHVGFSLSREVAVVAPFGEQDLATSDELRGALEQAREATQLVVLDFAGVTFADSSTMGVIVGAAKACRSTGRRLIVVNSTGIADRALRLTGLDVYFPDPEAALHQELPALLGGS